jgi:translation initiation factor 1
VSQNNSKTVFSTDREIPRKDSPIKASTIISLPPSEQKVTARIDRKGRSGKSVTIIDGLQMTAKDMEFLLKHLKGKLGTGGTLKETSLEIQGDRCDAVMDALRKMGYRPKRSGG